MTAGYQRSWENRRERARARTAGDEARESYYGLPVIHKPHWKWEIYTYFFLGGIAGASFVLAVIASWFGGKEGKQIARVARYLSFVTMLPSPVLLILDLGKPQRFHHMLRVFKLRSPMSVGTWVLVTFGAWTTVAAFIQAAKDGLLGKKNPLVRLLLAIPEKLVDVLGVPPSAFLSGYTGVLLGATAVPLWTKNALLIGPLFVASAFSNAAAAISLILSIRRGTSHTSMKMIERFDFIAMLTELALLFVFKQRLGETIAKPMSEGRYGAIHKVGTLGAGIAAPLAIQSNTLLFGGKPSRTLSIIAALLTLIGGFLFRYVIVMAGKESADDPKATFEMTGRDRRAA